MCPPVPPGYQTRGALVTEELNIAVFRITIVFHTSGRDCVNNLLNPFFECPQRLERERLPQFAEAHLVVPRVGVRPLGYELRTGNQTSDDLGSFLYRVVLLV